jgi:nitrite reductase (NADH) large subunit
MTDYLIVGSGVAGTTAAGSIREHDTSGRIVLLGEEELPLYSRIRLPEYLAGRVEREKLVIRKPGWHADKKIELNTGIRAEAIDPATSRVRLADGSSLTYDRLLLATGASCFVPPIAGHRLDGVMTIRTVVDVERMQAGLKGSKSVVVVGGGLLGLELAGALNMLGLEVTVVELEPWLLPRQLDQQGGDLLQGMLEREGLRFRTAAKVAEFEGKDSIKAVRLSDGQLLPASLVLVSAGVRPRVELAREAGLEVGRGILIDDSTATSAPKVYAAGDCAEHRGITYGIWPAAEAQGWVAGARMAAASAAYTGTLPSHSLKVCGIDVFSAGHFDVDDQARCARTLGENTYRKLVVDQAGNTVGAILIGDVSERGRILQSLTSEG